MTTVCSKELYFKLLDNRKIKIEYKSALQIFNKYSI